MEYTIIPLEKDKCSEKDCSEDMDQEKCSKQSKPLMKEQVFFSQ